MNDSDYKKVFERNWAIAQAEFPNVLQRAGLFDPNKPNKKYHCIAHDDRNTPNMQYDIKRNKLHCFSCGFDEDIAGYMGQVYGIKDKKGQFKKVFEVLGLKVDMNQQTPSSTGSDGMTFTAPIPRHAEQTDYSDYISECAQRVDPSHYLQTRGISAEVAQEFRIGFDPEFRAGKNVTWQAVIIPTSKHSFVARNTAPNTDKKFRYQKRGNTSCFNIGTLNDKENRALIWLVEGEIDALSIIQAGGRAIGLGSTSGVHGLTSALDNYTADAFRFVFALDNDKAGDEAGQTLLEYFKARGIQYFKKPEFLAESGLKDVNEYLTFRGEAELRECIKEAEQGYLEERHNALSDYQDNLSNVGAKYKAFLTYINSDIECIPTGMKGLDSLLDGGLYEGLYVIGAQPAAGKTALVHQMADFIARGEGGEGGRLVPHDVLYFSLEMSRFELMARSISRLTLELGVKYHLPRKCWKTARGIQIKKRRLNYSPQELALIEQAKTEYLCSSAPNFYLHEGLAEFGMDYIRDAILQHIKLTNRRPVVIIDYLQIIPQDYGDKILTEKQHMDRVIVALKKLARDNHLPIVAISSLNRGSYENVSLSSYKESGAVEFTADVALGLERDTLDRSPGAPVPIVLKVLKNRHGMRDKNLTMNFYGEFSYFEDVGCLS
jgi:replicative DNA helicase